MFLHSRRAHTGDASAGSFGLSDNPVNNTDTRAGAPGRVDGVASGSLHGFLERSATILFPFLFTSALLSSCSQLSQGWLIAPGVLLGLVFGDFVTALVHWAADTYGEEDTPVIGRSLVRPFRVHHVRPHEICEHGLVETVGNACILAAPLLTLFIVFMASGETSTISAFAVFTAVVTVGVTVATNQFHKWAHQDAPPRIVRALQRSRIILSRGHHRVHHTEPFESSYAITNGWLNPLLNRARFFRRLEGVLRTFGVEPSGRDRG